MPAETTCFISVDLALAFAATARAMGDTQSPTVFWCRHCEQSVRHHFEHVEHNPECPTVTGGVE